MGCVLNDVTLPVAPRARVRPRVAWWWCGSARVLRARSKKGLMCAQDRKGLAHQERSRHILHPTRE